MISPSRRKLPITRRNTPTFASALGWALAGLALLAPYAWPVCGDEVSRIVDQRIAEAQAASVRGGHAPSTRFSGSGAGSVVTQPAITPPIPAAKPKAKKTATVAAPAARPGAGAGKVDTTTGPAVSARPAKRPLRAVHPVAYDELSVPGAIPDEAGETVPQIDEPVPQIGSIADNSTRQAPTPAYDPIPADDAADIAARRARLQAQLTRPFKQIKEIRPWSDYEPDAEQAALDRCFNLCPRPGSPDCPECDQPGPDGVSRGGMPCPECPVEINLRETAHMVGSVNDYPTRNFPHMSYCWEPTNLYAYPLYFEDFTLERYGHTRHYLVQAPFSMALFTAQFVGLPYQITIDPIAKRRYALGWYRPGQYVPYKYYQVPWNTEAALVEAGVLAGSVLLWAPGIGP